MKFVFVIDPFNFDDFLDSRSTHPSRSLRQEAHAIPGGEASAGSKNWTWICASFKLVQKSTAAGSSTATVGFQFVFFDVLAKFCANLAPPWIILGRSFLIWVGTGLTFSRPGSWLFWQKIFQKRYFLMNCSITFEVTVTIPCFNHCAFIKPLSELLVSLSLRFRDRVPIFDGPDLEVSGIVFVYFSCRFSKMSNLCSEIYGETTIFCVFNSDSWTSDTTLF